MYKFILQLNPSAFYSSNKHVLWSSRYIFQLSILLVLFCFCFFYFLCIVLYHWYCSHLFYMSIRLIFKFLVPLVKYLDFWCNEAYSLLSLIWNSCSPQMPSYFDFWGFFSPPLVMCLSTTQSCNVQCLARPGLKLCQFQLAQSVVWWFTFFQFGKVEPIFFGTPSLSNSGLELVKRGIYTKCRRWD